MTEKRKKNTDKEKDHPKKTIKVQFLEHKTIVGVTGRKYSAETFLLSPTEEPEQESSPSQLPSTEQTKKLSSGE